VTVALIIGISDLLAKFLAYTFVILGVFQPTGAVAAGAFETVFDDFYHFCVFVKPYSHKLTSSQQLLYALCQGIVFLTAVWYTEPRMKRKAENHGI